MLIGYISLKIVVVLYIPYNVLRYTILVVIIIEYLEYNILS